MKKNTNTYKYKFSVVIPIYNVEDYLEETIESVITQTIGFERNIQIILINDGSPDNSEAICLKYKEKYPNNIIYIKQKNKGVSSARNKGKKYIEGKYVCFLDSDDKWEKHSFKRVFKFFEKNHDLIDIVDCRVKHFDSDDSYYIYDSRYHSTRIVDANVDYSLTLLNTATTFIKASSIEDVEFDEKLKYSEDTKFINQVLLKKCKYGIKHDALYLYRKRSSNDSAVDKRMYSKDYYIGPLNYCFKQLVLDSLNRYKKVTKNLQALILSNILWRMKITQYQDVLSPEEQKKYLNQIDYLLDYIDDNTIADRTVHINQKLYVLSLKYKTDFWKELTISDKKIYFDKTCISNRGLENARVFKLNVIKDKIIIHGRINPIGVDRKFNYYFVDINTNKKYYAELFSEKNWGTKSFKNDYIDKGYLFRVELPINKFCKFQSFISYDDKGKFKIKLNLNKYNLSNKYKSYKVIKRKCILNVDDYNLIVKKYGKKMHLKDFVICEFDLLKKLKLKTFWKKNILYPIKSIKNKFYKLIQRYKKLENIIIFESNPAFSDNTKALFDEMINNNINQKYKIVWFVDDVKPFENISIKNVEFLKFFDPGNKAFKPSEYAVRCHKRAKIIIDSNRFIRKKNPNQKRIHMIHGSPIKNAAFYNLQMGDVDYVITQSKFFAPMDSKIRDIDINKIKPLGFARNDVIYQKEKVEFAPIDNIKSDKLILWLPTYRTHKTVGNKINNLKYGLACITNEKELLKLNEQLVKNNITIVIKFHPAEDTSIMNSFNLSNIVILKDEELKEANVNLYRLFYKFDALITDYSSVYFDFCLTKKNIALAISDIDDYIKNQGDFQYDYKDIVVGNYMYNIKDLLNFVDEVSRGDDPNYEERVKLIKRYDDYRDGQATKRIYEFLKKYF